MPDFLGVIDAAVSVDILLQLATALNETTFQGSHCDDVSVQQDKSLVNSTTLQFIFFDGEEALEHWNPPIDALFGSTVLATLWNNTMVDTNKGSITQLSRMKLMILLDLIGDEPTYIPSYFPHVPESQLAYQRMQPMLLSHLAETTTNTQPALIDDDHKPFLHLGVPILHLIPTDFYHGENKCWHKMCDDFSRVDVEASSNILTALHNLVRGYYH